MRLLLLKGKKKVLPLKLKFTNLKGEFTSQTTEIGIEVSYVIVF